MPGKKIPKLIAYWKRKKEAGVIGPRRRRENQRRRMADQIVARIIAEPQLALKLVLADDAEAKYIFERVRSVLRERLTEAKTE